MDAVLGLVFKNDGDATSQHCNIEVATVRGVAWRLQTKIATRRVLPKDGRVPKTAGGIMGFGELALAASVATFAEV